MERRDPTQKALVLAGGGARGSYQVGVWRALMELDWHPQIITGTSVGGLNGAMFVLDRYETARDMWLTIRSRDVMELPEENADLSALHQFLRRVVKAGGMDVTPLEEIVERVLDEDALRRARRAAGDGGAVRLGVSMMCPGRQTLSMWSGIHDLEPSLRFEIVPVSDLYDERETVMRSLGREVDVVQSSFSTPRWGDACQKLLIVNVPFYIDVPRTSPLARKTRITVADLEGMRLRVLRHGNDAMDSLRIDLLADGGVDVIDVDSFDFALFNEAEEKGDAVLTCGAWSGVHPAFVGVPFLCGREVPVFLHYPLEPTLQVQKFVNAMAQLLNS